MKSASTIHAEPNHFDEQELVTRVLNGDADAFNPLVRKYQQKIYRLIYRQVHDRETAKDLCQETFLKAWQALPKFKGQSVFYTWL
ncbi:MAG: sigma-70 family RNA polymerase sigma factor, partial [Candidatus Poribacteria bacterium]|nr:sigma-70 family RNA polymerase sigma factor [Candidatus Poribacteria bacterium]